MLRAPEYEIDGLGPLDPPVLEAGIAATYAAKQLPLPRYYNVEGEASMRTFDPVVIDMNRAAALLNRKKSLKGDDRDYESWLWTFANLSDGHAEPRAFHRWNKARQRKCKVKVNIELACTLMAGEEWGQCEKTREEHLKRTRLSQFERTNSSTGKLQVVKGSANPPLWTASTSKQSPVGGYENRARPPSHVEMVRRLNPGLDVNCRSAVYAIRTGGLARKPVKVMRTETRFPTNRPLTALALAEVLILTDATLARNAAARRREDLRLWELKEFRRKRIDERVLRETESRIKYRLRALEFEMNRVELSTDPVTGLIDNSPHENIVAAYWHSWWLDPKAMRNAAYNSKNNCVRPTAQQILDFNEVAPMPDARAKELRDRYEYDNWFESRNDADDSVGLTNWLAKHVLTGNRVVTRPPTREGMTANEFRLAMLEHSYQKGMIHPRGAYLKAREALGKLIANESVSECRDIVAVGDAYGDPKRKSFPKSTINHKLKGLPSARGFGGTFVEVNGCDRLPQMTTLEYENISRVMPSSIDTYTATMVNAFRDSLYLSDLVEQYSSEASNDEAISIEPCSKENIVVSSFRRFYDWL